MEIHILKENLIDDMGLVERLNQFFKHHKGWKITENLHTLDMVIKFYNPEIFKQFLVEFAETKVGHALSREDALLMLEKHI